MKIQQQFAVSGHVQLITHDGTGRRTREGQCDADFPNLILNSGLDYLPQYGFAYPTSYAQVGAGNTAPVATQTGLVSPIASSGSTISFVTSYVAAPVPYMQSVRTIRFGVGAAAGNLAEIAMAPQEHTSGVPAYCRALVKDGDGVPTVLVVLEDEALDVVYTQRLYLPTTTQTGSVVIAGTTHNFTSLLSLVDAESDTNSDGWMNTQWPAANGSVAMWAGQIFSAVSDFGSQAVGIDGTDIPGASWDDPRTSYVGGTYARTMNIKSTVETIPTGVIAAAKLRWAYLGPATKVQFTPAIPIDETQSITFSCGVTFARYAP